MLRLVNPFAELAVCVMNSVSNHRSGPKLHLQLHGGLMVIRAVRVAIGHLAVEVPHHHLEEAVAMTRHVKTTGGTVSRIATIGTATAQEALTAAVAIVTRMTI